MLKFIQKHAQSVIGILSGFDRLRLRGTIRLLATLNGLKSFLWTEKVLLKDFRDYALAKTEDLRRATNDLAEATGRPQVYLERDKGRKEDIAKEIAERDGIQDGLICVLSCLEGCRSFTVGGNRELQRKVLKLTSSRCLHQYFYFQDRELGLFHARLQTYFPFNLQVCLNGREWLARQLDHAGIGYVRRKNCFTHIEDLERAQQMLDTQLNVNWKSLMDNVARHVNPGYLKLSTTVPLEYYWSVDESEWATDVMFHSADALDQLYPRWIRHGMETVSSADVMRFLGRRVPLHGGINGNFQGQVTTDIKLRPEGVRIMHRLNKNSLKMYDKEEQVLRIETTVNDVADMKVYRPKEGDAEGLKDWRPLRKGVADIHRRATVCQAANERYLEHLAAVEETQPLGPLAERVTRSVKWKGKSARGLNPLADADAKLFTAVNRGEFTINGFRNRDLRPLLFGTQEVDAAEAKRQAAKVTRLVRLLQAHGLVQKVTKTHRYMLTKSGITIITALLTARQADTQKLAQLAA